MTGHKTKVCPRCYKRKTLSARNFSFAVSKATGKRLWKHCRLCDRKEQAALRAKRREDAAAMEANRAYDRAYQRKHRDRVTDRRRIYRERLRAEDPDRYFEQFLLPQRFKSEGRQQKRRATDSHRAPSAAETVPAEPLRDYLLSRFPGWTPEEIHTVLRGSVSPRGLWRVLTAEADKVTLDLADRLLTHGLGRPDLLNTIYPMGSPHA